MKKKSDIVVLEMSPVGPFYSPNDEAAFFEWLNKIKAVKKYYGRLRTLCIEVKISKTSEADLRDLLAVFHRYKINRKQLIVFDRKDFSHWFRNKNASWYKPIFGKKTRTPIKKKVQKNKRSKD